MTHNKTRDEIESKSRIRKKTTVFSARSVWGILLLWIGTVGGSGSIFAINVLIARDVGAAAFGIYASVYAIATIFSVAACFGIAQFWLKAFGSEGWSATRWVGPSLLFQMLVVSVTLTFFCAWAIVGPNDAETRNLLMLMAIFVAGQTAFELVAVKFQLEERYYVQALWQLLPNLLRLLLVFLTFYVLDSARALRNVGLIYAGTSFLLIVVAIFELRAMKSGHFMLKGHGEQRTSSKEYGSVTIANVLLESWPFGVSALFAFIYLQIDIVMIKYMAGNIEAGYYNVAFIIVTASLIFPNVIYQRFFLGKYHRWSSHDRQKLHQFHNIGAWAMLAMGLVTMVVLISTSWFMIPLLFGAHFQPSVQLLNTLAIGIPFYFLSYNSGAALVTDQHIRLKLWLMGSVAIINVLLNAVLIPRYMAFGAAVATIVSYAALMVLYEVAVRLAVFAKQKGGGN